MRYLLIIIIILIPFNVGAVTGEDVRWDWSLGEPTITDDPTNACSDTAVARFDWSLGQPTVVFDTTATCAAAPAAAEDPADVGVIWFYP